METHIQLLLIVFFAFHKVKIWFSAVQLTKDWLILLTWLCNRHTGLKNILRRSSPKHLIVWLSLVDGSMLCLPM